jgi:hypothetical protein
VPDASDVETPRPLQATYKTPHANSAVPLYAGSMIFNRDGQRIQGNGEVLLEWLPSPRLRSAMRTRKALPRDVKLTLSLILELPGKKDCSIEPPDNGQSLRALTVSAGHVSDSEFRMSGTATEEIATGARSAISAVLFHLPNVPQFAFSPDCFVHRTRDVDCSWDRVILRCDPWIVTLDPVQNEQDLLKIAATTRG